MYIVFVYSVVLDQRNLYGMSIQNIPFFNITLLRTVNVVFIFLYLFLKHKLGIFLGESGNSSFKF